MSVNGKPVVKPVKLLTPFGAALAGALGGCFSNAVVYPLDVAKTRIQASSSNKGKGKASAKQRSLFGMVLYILNKEGVAGCYSGFGATMLNTFSMQYAYFFFYSLVRTSYLKRLIARQKPGSPLPVLSTAAELLLGAAAGALAQIFTIPVSVIATRQQVGQSSDDLPSSSGAKKVDNSFFTVAKEIVAKEGVTGLWLGLKPSLVLTVNPAITYGMFERVKGIILLAKEKAGGDNKLTSGQSFLVGALSKTLATVVTYPYIFAKVRIQARNADEESAVSTTSSTQKHRHDGALDILGRVLRERGIVGWYQGMSAQIIKAVLSQALLFMSKEHFEAWAFDIIALFQRFATHAQS